jgi:hypothetical protein
MESYSNATAYDCNDYSCNKVTRNHTVVSVCHYCHYIIDNQILTIRILTYVPSMARISIPS